jgi:proteic killer suppression protein
MIVRFRHTGLARFFATGSAAQIQPAHRCRLKLILTTLNTAQGYAIWAFQDWTFIRLTAN